MRRSLHRLNRFLRMLFACAAVSIGRGEEPALATSAGPVLYLFAHQDDEVFVLGKMRREVLEGREVHALWITNGAAHGYAVKREQESRTVMARVGVPPDRLHFLKFPDHASYHHLEAIHTQVMAIASTRPFAELTSPAFEGGNIDHDVTALMATLAAAEMPTQPVHFEFPLYNRFNGKTRYGVFQPAPGAAERHEMLNPERQKFVGDCLNAYGSQWLLLSVLKIIGHKNSILARGEPYRVAPPCDFLHRPADQEKCGYETTLYLPHRLAFAEWTKAVEPFLRVHPVGANVTFIPFEASPSR
jgi:LmbE family N-acetylglucosaminyl deacetylase